MNIDNKIRFAPPQSEENDENVVSKAENFAESKFWGRAID